MSNTTLLIDGDIVLYWACAGSEEETDWGDDWWSLTADTRQAKQMVDSQVASWKALLGADKVVFVVSDPEDNWRYKILPSYKGNRLGKRKPLGYPEVREYAFNLYNGVRFPKLEADDVLGLLSTGTGVKGRKIIVSEDKDLKTIPGLLYNPNRAEEGVREISVAEADRWHLYQTLTGDATDNYKGCPGIGPVSADKLLDVEPSWATVKQAYEKAGLSEDEALRQAAVARILRHGEYDYTKQEVKVWKPA